MTRLRGLVQAYAMARPRHGAREAELVRSAFAAMPAGLTDRAKAMQLAARVVTVLMAEPADEIETALAELAAITTADPAMALARDAESNLVALVIADRVRRFVARGARQISPAAWQAETEEIAEAVKGKLAERFRRKARESGR